MSDSSNTLKAGYGKTVDSPYAEVLAKTEEALKREGFGILTRIDVKATLKQKLDVDRPPYEILGACMPPMANRALQAVPEVGIMLPCNVVVREVADGKTRVEVVNTDAMSQMFPNAELAEVAKIVGQHLDNVLESI